MFTNTGSLFASDSAFVVLTFLPMILYVVLTGFGVYFIIKVIKFMNAKTKSDQIRNEKMDELIKAISRNSDVFK